MQNALHQLRVTNYRSARHMAFELSNVGAFIGAAGAGKSNTLGAVASLLDPGRHLTVADVTRGEERITIEATLVNGTQISLTDHDKAPPVVVLPARLRSTELIRDGHSTGPGAKAMQLMQQALDHSPAPRVALVHGLEACAEQVTGVVFVIEEPELFLAPQGQRFLYRLFHKLAASGNQVLYSTHSPGLLNPTRLEEIYLVSRDGEGVSAVEQMEGINTDDEFRALCEFNADRSELFFSRAALLVEGMTEKIVIPYVFEAMGYDIDREAISVVDCGGKGNLPLFAEICRRSGVPYVMLFDSDLQEGQKAPDDLKRANRRLRTAAGKHGFVALEPDLESVLGIPSGSRKPARALHAITDVERDSLPKPLVTAVERTVARARDGQPSYS